MPRILFAYRYLENEYKDVAFRRALKDLSFYSKIPIPRYYQNSKKYGARRATSYKGKPLKLIKFNSNQNSYIIKTLLNVIMSFNFNSTIYLTNYKV